LKQGHTSCCSLTDPCRASPHRLGRHPSFSPSLISSNSSRPQPTAHAQPGHAHKGIDPSTTALLPQGLATFASPRHPLSHSPPFASAAGAHNVLRLQLLAGLRRRHGRRLRWRVRRRRGSRRRLRRRDGHAGGLLGRHCRLLRGQDARQPADRLVRRVCQQHDARAGRRVRVAHPRPEHAAHGQAGRPDQALRAQLRPDLPLAPDTDRGRRHGRAHVPQRGPPAQPDVRPPLFLSSPRPPVHAL